MVRCFEKYVRSGKRSPKKGTMEDHRGVYPPSRTTAKRDTLRRAPINLILTTNWGRRLTPSRRAQTFFHGGGEGKVNGGPGEETRTVGGIGVE